MLLPDIASLRKNERGRERTSMVEVGSNTSKSKMSKMLHVKTIWPFLFFT